MPRPGRNSVAVLRQVEDEEEPERPRRRSISADADPGPLGRSACSGPRGSSRRPSRRGRCPSGTTSQSFAPSPVLSFVQLSTPPLDFAAIDCARSPSAAPSGRRRASSEFGSMSGLGGMTRSTCFLSSSACSKVTRPRWPRSTSAEVKLSLSTPSFRSTVARAGVSPGGGTGMSTESSMSGTSASRPRSHHVRRNRAKTRSPPPEHDRPEQRRGGASGLPRSGLPLGCAAWSTRSQAGEQGAVDVAVLREREHRRR